MAFVIEQISDAPTRSETNQNRPSRASIARYRGRFVLHPALIRRVVRRTGTRAENAVRKPYDFYAVTKRSPEGSSLVLYPTVARWNIAGIRAVSREVSVSQVSRSRLGLCQRFGGPRRRNVAARGVNRNLWFLPSSKSIRNDVLHLPRPRGLVSSPRQADLICAGSGSRCSQISGLNLGQCEGTSV